MIDIRLMNEADVPWGMQLKAANGWNQTEADWHRFLALEPDGCFVAELDGRPAGTLTTCRFGPVAWIAMVLVDHALRRRGVARALMTHALARLDAAGVGTVRLDATPLGQPLYEQLGFATEYVLDRYEGILPPGPPVPEVRAAREVDLPNILALDQSATGTDRRNLLRRLFDESAERIRVFGDMGGEVGYLGSRPGSRAQQIGPCIATAEAGWALLDDVRSRLGGQVVYVDVPTAHTSATCWAIDQGLTVQRTLLRMCRGPAVVERGDLLWASYGPELG